MSARLRDVAIPEFGVPEARPTLPSSTYAKRCDKTISRAGVDWVAVYADREHLANIAFLTGFEPRFEEAILLLGHGGERIFLCGNESYSYTAIAGIEAFEVVLVQSLSLMGQDRSQSPSLERALRDCGVKAGQSIGVIGWKYLDDNEWDGPGPAIFAPSFIVQVLDRIVGQSGRIEDCTSILMHPTSGMRSTVDADEIALLEWGAARASRAVWKIVTGARVGDSEFQAASRMGYAGEPLTCHVMLASGGANDAILGLRSPSARRLAKGDGVTTAVGYWGGLSCRGGMLTDHDDTFRDIASGYFEGLQKWYETVDIGVSGRDVYREVEATLAEFGLQPALNPGHLVSLDEWSHTPIQRDVDYRLASGMPFQVDIIPTPMKDGTTLNCEDGVALADADLRAALERDHPDVHARITARREFVRDALGIDLKPSILPLSSTPLCHAPFWLAPHRLLAAG